MGLSYPSFDSVGGLGFPLSLVVGVACSSLCSSPDFVDPGDWKFSSSQNLDFVVEWKVGKCNVPFCIFLEKITNWAKFELN